MLPRDKRFSDIMMQHLLSMYDNNRLLFNHLMQHSLDSLALIELKEQPLTLLISGETIYAVYPRRIVTYVHAVVSEEILLTDEIHKIVNVGYFVFILYHSNRMEWRDLLHWDKFVNVGSIEGQVKSMIPHGSYTLILNMNTHLILV